MKNNMKRYTALEKFMSTMGITYTVKISKVYYNPRKTACVTVIAYYQGQEQFHKINCFSSESNGTVKFSDGNLLMSVKEGILHFLGEDQLVKEYFYNLGKQVAIEYLGKE